jgi:hypothetical protein
MVENHHRNRFSRKKFRVFSEFFLWILFRENNSEKNSEFSKPSKRKGGDCWKGWFSCMFQFHRLWQQLIQGDQPWLKTQVYQWW